MESNIKDSGEGTVKMFLNTSEYLQFLLSELSCVPPEKIPQSVKDVTVDLINSVERMIKNMEVSQASGEKNLCARKETKMRNPQGGQKHPYLSPNLPPPPRRPYSPIEQWNPPLRQANVQNPSYARSNSPNLSPPPSNAPAPRSIPPSRSDSSSPYNLRSMTPQSEANSSRRGSTSSSCSNVSSSNPRLNKPHQKAKTHWKNTSSGNEEGVAPHKREDTQPPPPALHASDLNFKSLLRQMSSYFQKSGNKLPAMFCLVCFSSFDSYFDWMEHIESPGHNLPDHTQHRCDTCSLEIYGLPHHIISSLQTPEHKEVDQLYSE